MSNDGDKIPLIETFGPVVQGEGMLVGKPTWFVRTGACDYRCGPCDSMHAVDPHEIEKRKTVMSAREIGERCVAEMGETPMVTLSGGNPALWDMEDFMTVLHLDDKLVAIETQGTVFKPWINLCDYITISPKGPGMIGDELSIQGLGLFKEFLQNVLRGPLRFQEVCVKIPVFDEHDILYAHSVLEITRRLSKFLPVYLSVGNSWVGSPGTPFFLDHLRDNLLSRYATLSELIMAKYPALQQCAILPQLHVLVYGNGLRR